MPIIDKRDVLKEKLGDGVDRWEIVNGDLGAEALTVSDVNLAPGARAPVHIHPTEEAMVVIDGELETILGEETINVVAGSTVLAPAGVKHGFVNRSNSKARVMGIFPTNKVERTIVE